MLVFNLSYTIDGVRPAIVVILYKVYYCPSKLKREAIVQGNSN
jgi:hypothetical protein